MMAREARDPGEAGNASPEARLHAYVVAWLVAAAAVVGALVAAAGGVPELATSRQLALIGAIALAEATELNLRLSPRVTSAFTLIEIAIAATLVLLDPAEAVLAVAAGVIIGNVLRRRPLLRLGFNAGQITVATGAAAVVASLVPAVGPMAGDGHVVAATAGMAVYGIINFLAIGGLLRIIGDGDVRRTIREQGWLVASALLGDVPVGLLGAELALTRVELLPLLLAPIAAIYLAQRGMTRTQQLLAQARQDHERLDRVVAGTSDGILLLDADATVEVWNDALTALTGVPASRALGEPVARVLGPARVEHPIDDRWLLDTADPGSPNQIVESRLQHLVDGHVRVVRESHTFRFDERGRCVGDVVVFTDVTREHEVAEMKSDFVARVSHELRTPLTPIKGFAGMLLKRGEEMSDDQRELALERIVERTDRMAALVEDLLLVTQLGGDVQDLVSPRRCEVDEVVEAAVTQFRDEHPGRNIFVTRPDGSMAAMADPDRVQQILTHLVDNALRYSDSDTPVEVSIALDVDDVVVDVVDHGPGIAARQQDEIFEAFHRLEDPLRMQTSGVGVGLFIARRLAHAMHGDVRVRSRVGHGSTFSLRIPRHRAPVLVRDDADKDAGDTRPKSA